MDANFPYQAIMCNGIFCDEEKVAIIGLSHSWADYFGGIFVDSIHCSYETDILLTHSHKSLKTQSLQVSIEWLSPDHHSVFVK